MHKQSFHKRPLRAAKVVSFMEVVDTFKQVDAAILDALHHLENILNGKEMNMKILNSAGAIEVWINDFCIPNNPGYFRMKIVIDRTNEHGDARMPILSSNEDTDKQV